MPRYEVQVKRTEMITFALEATDPQDAENRYLGDGDETGSYLVEHSIETID